MTEKHVKDLMIPIEDYAMVTDNMPIWKAIDVMVEMSEKLSVKQYKHQAVLVKNENGDIVGRLTQADILKGLEPKYKDVGGSFLTPLLKEKLADMMSDIPDDTFLQRCKAQKDKPVRDFMTTVTLSIDEGETISHALHVMLISDHRSLLVTRKRKNPVGILRLTDVFLFVKEAILD